MDCLNLMAGWCQQQYFSLILCWVRVGGGCGHWGKWGQSEGVLPGPSPAAQLSWRCAKLILWVCSGSSLLVFIQLHMSYLNLLLENPLCYLKRSSCFLMFFHYTGKECGYINIWLSLVVCLCRCISVADVFLFWAETLFPWLCGPCPSLSAQ